MSSMRRTIKRGIEFKRGIKGKRKKLDNKFKLLKMLFGKTGVR